MAKVNGNLIFNADASAEIQNVFLHRLTTTERDALGLGPLQESQTIYNTTVGKFQYWDGTSWQNTASEDFVVELRDSFDGKPSVRLATVTALPAYTAAGSGVGKTLTADFNGALSLDGETAALNDRVLVKNEATSHVDHGIYDVTDPGSVGSPWILTRSTDTDEDAEITANMYVFVSEGTQADSGWILLTNDPIIVDTTALQFDQFSTPGFSGSIDDLSDVTLTTPAAGDVLLHDGGTKFLNKNIQFIYESSAFALPEITDVTTVADVSGSLSGTHFLLDSPTTTYYVWMDVATRAEITVISFTGVANGAAFGGNGNPGLYWSFGDGSAGTALPFYVWYDVTDVGGGNTDPIPFPATEGITVAILAADTATAVMTKTDTALNAFLHLGSTSIVTSSPGTPGVSDLTMTNVATGIAADAAAATAGGAGVAIGAITQGLNVAVDPSVPGRTRITVPIIADNTNTTVASATQAVIDVEGDFGASVLGAVVTITNAAVDNVPDAVDVDTGFTILVTQQGVTTAVTTHAINHNLGQKYCNVTVVNDSDFVILPLTIEFIDTNNLTITISSGLDVKAVIIGFEGVGLN
ncbi:hypothetical protein LCGC14_0919120 [marine sediment metagenome]|uniref:Uncharacterized protein n=1 Tax=marine sediment metagenome TaxID=412755 RepID=A0A0F9NRH0_9ZZZZ